MCTDFTEQERRTAGPVASHIHEPGYTKRAKRNHQEEIERVRERER